MSSDQNKQKAELEFKTSKILRKKNRQKRKGERIELREIVRKVNNGEVIDE